MSRQHVEIDYTNHRGERRCRVIWPVALFWGTTRGHSKRQWFVSAWDVERDTRRDFALKDIHSWQPVAPKRAPAKGE